LFLQLEQITTVGRAFHFAEKRWNRFN